jgi:predicted peptidase
MSMTIHGRLRCRPRLALLLAMVLLGVIVARAAVALETGFINGVVKSGSNTMPYVVFVPREHTEEKEWPVILFLHGAGERGSDGFLQVRVGIGPQLWLNPRRFPCLVVMPQAPSAGDWSGKYNDLALRAMEEVIEKYHGDRNRLYLTGLSMGGFGTWDIAANYPERFAAIIPICGGGDPATAPQFKSLPIWVFHGGADNVVPPRFSRDMVAAIKAAGNITIQYTEYPGAGHNSWDRTYANRLVIEWLLAQKRGS